MNKPIKYILVLVLLIVSLVSIRVLYSWWFYIDESVTEGSGYGFTIGSTKDEVIVDIVNLQKQNPEAFISLYDKSKNTYLEYSFMDFASEQNLHDEYHRWEIILDKNTVSNSITLIFESDNLSRIYRHRKDFDTL